MCMYVNNKELVIKIAEKDIEVWKYLVEGKSPYYSAPFHKGTTHICGSIYNTTDGKFGITAVASTSKSDLASTYFIVNEGLHSFKSRGSALGSTIDGRLVKMVIPKGTMYIEGSTRGMIVSQKLRWPKDKKKIKSGKQATKRKLAKRKS